MITNFKNDNNKIKRKHVYLYQKYEPIKIMSEETSAASMVIVIQVKDMRSKAKPSIDKINDPKISYI